MARVQVRGKALRVWENGSGMYALWVHALAYNSRPRPVYWFFFQDL
jgi:hypothetical protein